MAPRLRRAPLAAALALAALFGLVAALVASGATAGLDAQVDAATRAPAAAVVWTAWALDAAGSVWAVGAFVGGAALAMLARGRRSEALLFGGAALAEEVLVQGIKLVAARPRPDGGVVEALGASFPSGHAARAAFLATLAVALAWSTLRSPAARWGAALAGATAALAMAASRVALHVHWASDAAAGTLAGAAVGLAAVAAAPGARQVEVARRVEVAEGAPTRAPSARDPPRP